MVLFLLICFFTLIFFLKYAAVSTAKLITLMLLWKDIFLASCLVPGPEQVLYKLYPYKNQVLFLSSETSRYNKKCLQIKVWAWNWWNLGSWESTLFCSSSPLSPFERFPVSIWTITGLYPKFKNKCKLGCNNFIPEGNHTSKLGGTF